MKQKKQLKARFDFDWANKQDDFDWAKTNQGTSESYLFNDILILDAPKMNKLGLLGAPHFIPEKVCPDGWKNLMD